LPNLYEVLGVPRSADADTIKKAYKKLARTYHPDVNQDPAAETKFKEINAAYDVLGDEKKRANYDQFGDANGAAAGGFPGGFSGGFPGGFGGHGVDMSDILGSMFGGGFSSGPQRGRDVQVRTRIDPMTTFVGGETIIAFQRADGRASVRVPVPAGTKDGQKVRVRGEGSPPPHGGPCGDLFVQLEVGEHPLLRRDGDDLEMDVPLTILEALRGTQLTVPTPTGNVRVTVKGGVRSGQRLRIRGKGVQRKGQPGDLFLVLRPQVPETTDPAMLAAAEALESAYGGDVRAGLQL